jgi:hypothetical protein
VVVVVAVVAVVVAVAAVADVKQIALFGCGADRERAASSAGLACSLIGVEFGSS